MGAQQSQFQDTILAMANQIKTQRGEKSNSGLPTTMYLIKSEGGTSSYLERNEFGQYKAPLSRNGRPLERWQIDSQFLEDKWGNIIHSQFEAVAREVGKNIKDGETHTMKIVSAGGNSNGATFSLKREGGVIVTSLKGMSFNTNVPFEGDDSSSRFDIDKLYKEVKSGRIDLLKEIQNREILMDDLKYKTKEIEGRQDLYLEETRLDIEKNKEILAQLDNETAVLKRMVKYDMEGDLVHNSKIFFLGNICLYLILFFIVIVSIRFLSE